MLFARCAILVEGYGDRIAALTVAGGSGLDVDAEAVAVVDCGGKAGIELIVGICRALDIPFVVLHDEDVWPAEQMSNANDKVKQKTQEENAEARKLDGRIWEDSDNHARLFTLIPSLEAVLGIGRHATDRAEENCAGAASR